MKTETAKHMIDALREGKRILDDMPALEPGYTPASVRMLDTIQQMESEGMTVHPSDISDRLHTSRPGTTRTLKQLEAAGAITKDISGKDGRSIIIHISERGQEIYQKYVVDYYQHLTSQLRDISDEEVKAMIQTILKIEKAVGTDGGRE